MQQIPISIFLIEFNPQFGKLTYTRPPPLNMSMIARRNVKPISFHSVEVRPQDESDLGQAADFEVERCDGSDGAATNDEHGLLRLRISHGGVESDM